MHSYIDKFPLYYRPLQGNLHGVQLIYNSSAKQNELQVVKFILGGYHICYAAE